jgi:L-ascorbate metabolism protein UlaG (beta-lactamase superfamily)
MPIEFINHACVIIEHQGTRIMNDPWLWGIGL